MTRVGFSPAGKTTKHSELTDVSTPHVLADLVNAVCSETEADGKITTHGTGSKHRWTLNKLRKGAGAGSNPTEIDVPSGKTIVTGNYTGNDGADRQIATGFTCSLVIVICETNNICWLSYDTAVNLALDTGGIGVYGTGDNRVVLHATDGFIVDGDIADGSNKNGNVYYYWAISE